MPGDENALFDEMLAWEAGCPQRLQHLVKVRAFAKRIGEAEGLPADAQRILEIAALTHDIGIRPSLDKHGSAEGPWQELEGPPAAEAMLSRLNYPRPWIERVCYLIGHHHTYEHIDGPDYRILVEADFLVNLWEGAASPEAIRRAYAQIFRTEAGKKICRTMFAIDATGEDDPAV